MGSDNSPRIDPTQTNGAKALSPYILQDAMAFSGKYGAGANMPQQTIVGYNPYQTSTMDQLQATLGQANPLTSSASGYIGDVLNGKYLDPASNPALAASGAAISSGAQRYLNQNLDQIGSNFALAGGTSSSAMANAKKSATVASADSVGQSLAQLYGNAYTNERANQSNAVGAAQSLSQDPTQRLMAALGLGGQQQAMSQSIANLPLQNYMMGQQAQSQSLQTLLGAMQGVSSGYMMPSYAPSQLSQNMGMIFGGLGALGGLASGGADVYGAYKAANPTPAAPTGAH